MRQIGENIMVLGFRCWGLVGTRFIASAHRIESGEIG